MKPTFAVRVVQHVYQNKGKGAAYVQRTVDWPVGLSMPDRGDFLTFAPDDEDEVRDVQYSPLGGAATPLGSAVATIVLRDATAEDPETAQEWCARRRPGWKVT